MAKWEECPACGEGVETRKIEIEPSSIILKLFDVLKYEGFDFDPEQSMISKELTKQSIWNPFVEKLKNPDKSIEECGIQDHDMLLVSMAGMNPLRILTVFV